MPGTSFLQVRQQILSAALDLFAERGPDAVSLRQLASRIGLHNSTLFHYFPDKAALEDSVLDAVAQRQLEWLERLEADDPPHLETLGAVLGGWEDHLRTAVPEARLLLGALAGPGCRTPTRPPLERLAALLAAWLERAHAAGIVRCPIPAQGARAILALALFRPPGAPMDSPAGELARIATTAYATSPVE